MDIPTPSAVADAVEKRIMEPIIDQVQSVGNKVLDPVNKIYATISQGEQVLNNTVWGMHAQGLSAIVTGFSTGEKYVTDFFQLSEGAVTAGASVGLRFVSATPDTIRRFSDDMTRLTALLRRIASVMLPKAQVPVYNDIGHTITLLSNTPAALLGGPIGYIYGNLDLADWMGTLEAKATKLELTMKQLTERPAAMAGKAMPPVATVDTKAVIIATIKVAIWELCTSLAYLSSVLKYIMQALPFSVSAGASVDALVVGASISAGIVNLTSALLAPISLTIDTSVAVLQAAPIDSIADLGEAVFSA